MREWLSSLSVDRLPEVALVVAAGYAFATLADDVARLATSVLAQHLGSDPSGGGDSVLGLVDLFSAPYYLSFSIGDTVVVYGGVVSSALALGLVAVGAMLIARRRDRELGECPFCASRIPYESTHCAYCGSGVAAREP